MELFDVEPHYLISFRTKKDLENPSVDDERREEVRHSSLVASNFLEKIVPLGVELLCNDHHTHCDTQVGHQAYEGSEHLALDGILASNGHDEHQQTLGDEEDLKVDLVVLLVEPLLFEIEEDHHLAYYRYDRYVGHKVFAVPHVANEKTGA